MIKQLTAQQHAKLEKKITEHAQTLLAKYTAEQVAQIIWNRYGYLSGTKNGAVEIQGRSRYSVTSAAIVTL
jgi:hypothetical protein